MSLERILDHEEQGVELLLSQYRGRPRLAAWLRSYLRQVQLLEDATFDVILKRVIDNAEGAQLDGIGRIVDERRLDRDDPTYRVFIWGRIIVNRSTGKMPDFVALLDVVNFENYSAVEFTKPGILFEWTDAAPTYLPFIYAMLRQAKAGGVPLSVIVPTQIPFNQFRFCHAGGLNVPSQGCGHAGSPGTGGRLSHALSP